MVLLVESGVMYTTLWVSLIGGSSEAMRCIADLSSGRDCMIDYSTRRSGRTGQTELHQPSVPSNFLRCFDPISGTLDLALNLLDAPGTHTLGREYTPRR